MTTGIIVGRFQVPYLHVGHLHLIATALRECDRVVILLGTTEGLKLDERNPFTTKERAAMIKRIFPHVSVAVLMDNPSDEHWSRNLDDLCGLCEQAILYHSRDSFKSHYSGKYPTKEVEEVSGFSGTKLRQENKPHGKWEDKKV